MTTKEAKLLLIGTVVFWKNDRSDLGTVSGLSPFGFFVNWENGARDWISYGDAEHISIY